MIFELQSIEFILWHCCCQRNFWPPRRECIGHNPCKAATCLLAILNDAHGDRSNDEVPKNRISAVAVNAEW